MSVSVMSKVTSKGQVTVPESIREEAHITAGDRLEWRTTPSGVIEVRRVQGQLEDLVGFLGRPPRSVTIEQMDEAVAEHFKREWT